MGKTLIVVDVQRAYSPFFTEEYLKEVKSFVENGDWDKVVVRFVGEDEYSVINLEPNDDGVDVDVHLHTFNEDARFIPDFLLNKDYIYSERFFGYDMSESEEEVEVVPNKLYKSKENGAWWYMSESPNGDYYCPCRNMESLLDDDNEIHIIGGFRDQCVKEVFDFFLFAGKKKVFIHDDYCFFHIDAEPDVDGALEFSKDWKDPSVILEGLSNEKVV